MITLNEAKIAIIGLGYVGLPLAVAFGRHFPTFGFDVDVDRIEELERQFDRTHEVSIEELKASFNLTFVKDQENIKDCNIYIVTVPTPIDEYKKPDLSPLCIASKMLGSCLNHGDIVIYESTVYPGATEEVCVPILEQQSGMIFNKDFFVGYSPERINPGDKKNRLENIVKVTSGSTKEAAQLITELYNTVVEAGIHTANSIKVAEAAKVIENTQRDLNIALMNELAIIFRKLGIDTIEVLEAAGTKWNFLPFRPGLVGGHCIGVDPYYLTHKAEAIGYHPEVILSGRRINDGMGEYIVSQVAKLMNKKHKLLSKSKVLVMGLTFKENCPDTRNSRVYDIIDELNTYEAEVSVFDPWLPDDYAIKGDYQLMPEPEAGVYDAIIIAVGHDEFISLGIDKIRAFGHPDTIICDVKSVFPKNQVNMRL